MADTALVCGPELRRSLNPAPFSAQQWRRSLQGLRCPLIASVFAWDTGGALASDLHLVVGRPRPPGFLQRRQSGALEPRLLMDKPHPGKGAPGAGNHTQRGSKKHVWGMIGKTGFIWVWTLLIMLVLNFQDICHFRVLLPKKTSVPSSAWKH